MFSYYSGIIMGFGMGILISLAIVYMFKLAEVFVNDEKKVKFIKRLIIVVSGIVILIMLSFWIKGLIEYGTNNLPKIWQI